MKGKDVGWAIARRVRNLSWYWWVRGMLLVMLADQWQIPLDFLAVPTDGATTVAIIMAIVAPVPTKRDNS